MSSPSSSNLPLKPIPGSYGLPFFGAIKDRLDYFYREGTDKFFRTRVQKYQSTVFRTNMVPGPFMAPNPKVVVLLDAVSFPVLFDTSKVEKRDVFVGTYMPSTDFTGGYRMCAYLDPSEPKHPVLKGLLLSTLATRHDKFIPVFRSSLSQLFIDLEDELSSKGKAYFNDYCNKMSFNYLTNLFCDRSPSGTILTTDKATKFFDSYLFFQLAPLITLGLPKILNILEDIVLHTFPLPPFLLKSDYKKFYKVFNEYATSILDEAESLGIERDEACHNLVFFVCFNAYGGMKNTFPALIKWVGLAGEELHRQLAEEIRTVVRSEGGVTVAALEKMSLTKSVVWEALRIEPSVAFQYGNAKEDMVIHNHDAAFEIKKGEMIFGYQPFATKDPRVFERPEEFVGHRFVGEEGEKLLKYVYWSNGREIDDPTVGNKQCPGKNMVVLLCRVMLVEFFLRYDTFVVEAGKLPLGSTVTFTSMSKATSS
ncbi:allene oxide synthase 1, chloroplastic-like [Rhodamnia argentea]|uniref:Allene oxide synthase 1, chloroplastic-like n=1 Tax=Rhodamnia argentea TaxID=178133 RepID=A0A8B8MYT6_9MYRT|nr:allene oxide synthase 1, chloroplastic-like [Rhodamnia argentea]